MKINHEKEATQINYIHSCLRELSSHSVQAGNEVQVSCMTLI